MALRVFVCNAIYSLRVLYEVTGARAFHGGAL